PSGFRIGTILRVQFFKMYLDSSESDFRKFIKSKTAFVVVDSFPCIWDHINIFKSPLPKAILFIARPSTDKPSVWILKYLETASRNASRCLSVTYRPFIVTSLISL